MSKTFCVLPWTHLATHPNGMVSLCCQSEMKDGASFAEIAGKPVSFNDDHEINDVLNCEKFRAVRLEMLRGEQPKICSGCYKQEELGLSSKRKYENAKSDFTVEDAENATNEDGSLDFSKTLSNIELRLGNLCNLKCVTCNPASSSSLYSDYRILESKISWLPSFKNITEIPRKTLFSWCDDWSFYKKLLSFSDVLKEIYINGGEPTLVDMHGKFLDELIKNGVAKKVELSYSINMSTDCDKFIERWKYFKQVTIKASIDDVGDKNEYIRKGSKWDKVVKNLDKLYDSGFSVEIIQTISAFNITTIERLAQFCQSRYNSPVIAYNLVKYPSFLSIDSIPSIEIDKTKNRIMNDDSISDYTKKKIIEILNSHQFNQDHSNKYLTYKMNLDSIHEKTYTKSN